MIKNDKPGVDRDLGVIDLDGLGVGVPAKPVGGFKYRDIGPARELPGSGASRDAAADDCDI